MVYLLLKIIACLLLASIFGAIIGWLLKHVIAKKHNTKQQQFFDTEREKYKEDMMQIKSNWDAKYQSLNKTHNNIQGLLNTSTQKNTLLSQSLKTTQQTLNDQGVIIKRLQADINKLGNTKDELKNKNNLLEEEVVKLRDNNQQITTLKDTITQLNNTQSSLETTLKETEAANKTIKKELLKKHHDLEKGDTVLKNKLKIATEKEQQTSDELIIEKQQLLSIQQNEEKQQIKNKATIITLRNKLKKIAKENTALSNEVSTLQQTKNKITTLKEKPLHLENNKQKSEETLKSNSINTEKIKQLEQHIQLLEADNSILKKDNKENDKKNTLLSNSLSSMTSKLKRYKRYLIESEKTWATKVYDLQLKAEENNNATTLEDKKEKLRIQTLNNRIADFKEERKKQYNTILHLTKENKQYQTDTDSLTTLKKQLEILTKQRIKFNDRLNKIKISSAEDKKQLQEKINQLNTELNNAKASSTEDKKQLQEKINQLNTELNNAKASSIEDKKQLQEKINQLNTEQDNTKASLLNDKEQLQTNIIQLHKKLTKTKSSTTKEKKRLQTTINQLNNEQQATINQLDNEQQATHIAQQAMSTCKQKLIEIENDNTQLNKTLKMLTNKNNHTETLLSATQQDYIEISQKYKTLSLELEQLHTQKSKATAINKTRTDDLQKIKGIGKYNERVLNKLGITHYAQIAHFTPQDEEKFGQELGVFAARISQEAWVGQAKVLHQDKYGETI